MIRVANLSPAMEIGKIEQFVKRLIDIVLSLVCILFLSIFMLLISIIIKITSKGPIIYKQKRIGYLGYPFTLYKFRSMYDNKNEKFHSEYINALQDVNYRIKDLDVNRTKISRSYTPIGKFLRKISADEIPQLFNILKGDMSLVGPRPHPDYEITYYKDWYFDRLTVKPGLTGLSKIMIRDSASDYCEAMKLDIWYIKNWSITLDIKIIFKTFYNVIIGKDAE